VLVGSGSVRERKKKRKRKEEIKKQDELREKKGLGYRVR